MKERRVDGGKLLDSARALIEKYLLEPEPKRLQQARAETQQSKPAESQPAEPQPPRQQAPQPQTSQPKPPPEATAEINPPARVETPAATPAPPPAKPAPAPQT